eukprot:NODE_1835_length_1053_cov_1.845691.p1 GENE.NODE_1835_length_1053_cov_1.845691~~NODE_1835_length_1053_cov_1.845691.p1  ORF type:complete len:211 (+),score=47.15 NODE_1835_length_1053_cov_1.845691:233-865(+)
MLQAVNKYYQKESGTQVQFFDDKGQPNMVAHELNERDQNQSVKTYEQSILKHGYMERARSMPMGQLSSDGKPPYRMISGAQITQAIYGVAKSHPRTFNVSRTLQSGMLIDIYCARTPDDVIVFLRDTQNSFQSGANAHDVFSVLDVVLEAAIAWNTYAHIQGIQIRGNKGNGHQHRSDSEAAVAQQALPGQVRWGVCERLPKGKSGPHIP